jgi:hypothetical protein
MKTLAGAAAVAALLALSACRVTIDNQSKANLDNAADSLGDSLGNAADTVGNAAERAGATIEKGADDIDNRIDVNVDLHGDRDGNRSAETNRQ